MADREKVIKGLTHCTAWSGLHECQPKVGDDCPYEDEADCQLSLMRDALALLKEYEPVKPITESALVDVFKVYSCGNCQTVFHLWRQKYCAICGRAVKWDADGA